LNADDGTPGGVQPSVETRPMPLVQQSERALFALRKIGPEARAAVDEDLVAACRGKIASYKVPRYWKLVESFPMTVTGKVQKFVMRERMMAELSLREDRTA